MSQRTTRELPGLVLLTRPGCHLCDVMKGVLEAEGAAFSSLDVDSDPDLQRRWGDTVPVLLRDGRAVAKVRLDAGQLGRIIRRRL